MVSVYDLIKGGVKSDAPKQKTAAIDAGPTLDVRMPARKPEPKSVKPVQLAAQKKEVARTEEPGQKKMGRPLKGARPMTSTERSRARRAKLKTGA